MVEIVVVETTLVEKVKLEKVTSMMTVVVQIQRLPRACKLVMVS